MARMNKYKFMTSYKPLGNTDQKSHYTELAFILATLVIVPLVKNQNRVT